MILAYNGLNIKKLIVDEGMQTVRRLPASEIQHQFLGEYHEQ